METYLNITVSGLNKGVKREVWENGRELWYVECHTAGSLADGVFPVVIARILIQPHQVAVARAYKAHRCRVIADCSEIKDVKVGKYQDGDSFIIMYVKPETLDFVYER